MLMVTVTRLFVVLEPSLSVGWLEAYWKLHAVAQKRQVVGHLVMEQ